MQQLTNDHIDLLVAAAVEFRYLTSATAAAFSSSSAHVTATPDLAGRLLLEQLPASAPADYRFRPVQQLDPTQVVKACHSYEHQAGSAPSYPGSRAEKLTALILRGATERLPGYADASWTWTRPRSRLGRPLGLATSSWVPQVEAIDWTEDIEEFSRRWEAASLIVITAAAAPLVPDHLAARPDVYLVTQTEELASAWPQVTSIDAELLLMLPEGRAWLEERLEQAGSPGPLPPVEFVNPRQTTPG